MKPFKTIARPLGLKPVALFVALLAASGLSALVTGAAQVVEKQRREVEDKVPKHLPIRVKVKHLDGENWARTVEVEVLNTSRKPIYSMSFSLYTPDIKSDEGRRFGFPLHYGRPALIDSGEKLSPEDVPLRPGETVTLKVPARLAEGWEKYSTSRNLSQPGKLGLDFHWLSYGDGTGYQTTGGLSHPKPRAALVDVAGDGIRLTNPAGGIQFDLNDDGTLEKFSWTVADTDDAWLTLDRNGTGTIDQAAELFDGLGPRTHGNFGFAALAEFDGPQFGGNGDGVIDGGDGVFASLRLWRDANRNGVSEAGEMHKLPALGVARLRLAGELSPRADEHGNRFLYRLKVEGAKDAKPVRWAWDVELIEAR